LPKEIELEDRFETWARTPSLKSLKNHVPRRRRHHTANVLARAILKEGLRNIVAGSNPTCDPSCHRERITPPVTTSSKWVAPSVQRRGSLTSVRFPLNNDTVIGSNASPTPSNVSGKTVGVITVEEAEPDDGSRVTFDGMQFETRATSRRTSSTICSMKLVPRKTLVLL